MSQHSIGTEESYAIDYFYGRFRAYFLTHVHTDHLQGLHDGWNRGLLYCSPQTKTLLSSLFTIEDRFIRALMVDEPNIVSISTHTSLTVTLLDANHCPGSTMFKICGSFGCRLHTGDFRYSQSLHLPSSNPFLEGVQHLFLDTTFFHPSWKMPTKEESCKNLITLIENHGHQKVVYIAADCYGQEELLVAIYERFGERVILDIAHPSLTKRTKAIWQNWAFRVPNVQYAVTTDVNCTSRFRTCAANGKGVSKAMRKEALNIFALAKRRSTEQMLIRASTLWFASRERYENDERIERMKMFERTQFSDVIKDRVGIWHIFYSMHSSYSELHDFIQGVGPECVHCGLPGEGSKVLAYNTWVQNPKARDGSYILDEASQEVHDAALTRMQSRLLSGAEAPHSIDRRRDQTRPSFDGEVSEPVTHKTPNKKVETRMGRRGAFCQLSPETTLGRYGKRGILSPEEVQPEARSRTGRCVRSILDADSRRAAVDDAGTKLPDTQTERKPAASHSSDVHDQILGQGSGDDAFKDATRQCQHGSLDSAMVAPPKGSDSDVDAGEPDNMTSLASNTPQSSDGNSRYLGNGVSNESDAPGDVALEAESGNQGSNFRVHNFFLSRGLRPPPPSW